MRRSLPTALNAIATPGMSRPASLRAERTPSIFASRSASASSRSALHPFAGAAGYCASKAAVIAFAQVVAREHADDGVRCNAVMPSMIDTPANRAAMPADQHGKLTPPGEIAAVIRFLCSEESAPTSGAAIPVYGGP